MKRKNFISIVIITIMFAVASITVFGTVSEDIAFLPSDESIASEVIPDGYVKSNDGKIIPLKIKEGTAYEATWNHETQSYIIDNLYSVGNEELLAMDKAEKAEYDARIDALCMQYYGEKDIFQMWLTSHLKFDGKVSETSQKLRELRNNGFRNVTMHSSLYIGLEDSFNEEGKKSLKTVSYSDMPDIYEHIKVNDASDRNLGLYVLYDMLGLQQTVDEFYLCQPLFGDYRWELICNAVFYDKLRELKSELQEMDSKAILSNSDKYGYLVLPVVRERAMAGDAASVAVVEKIMEKTSSDSRFASATSVSEWLDVNSDIIDSIQNIVET